MKRNARDASIVLVEPENRLVARSLEHSWEQKLRDTEKVEREYQDWLVQHRLEITPADRQEILSLGENLPKLWNSASTTPADRKHIVRLLIRDVVVDPDRVKGKVWFQINWQTGAISEHCYTRRVQNYANYPDLERLEQRIRQLHAQHQMDKQIASTLNAEGFRNAHLRLFSGKMIWILRTRLGLPTVIHQGYNPKQWEDGTYSIAGAAEILGVFPGTIYSWIRSARLTAFQVVPGTPWKIVLDDEKIVSLKKYLDRVRRSRKKAS